MRKWTILFHDGLGPVNPWPEEPSDRNTIVGNKQDIIRWFRQTVRESGNDYVRADGYSAPWADVYPADAWDGVSYGDSMTYRVEASGPKMGIYIENA